MLPVNERHTISSACPMNLRTAIAVTLFLLCGCVRRVRRPPHPGVPVPVVPLTPGAPRPPMPFIP